MHAEAASRLGLIQALAHLRILPSACLLIATLGACAAREPVVLRVTWTTPEPTDALFEEVNAHRVRVVHNGPRSVVEAWGTLYLSRDLAKARVWVTKESGGYLLCFHAPTAEPPPGTALAAIALPARFRYEISDLPANAHVRFVEMCEVDAGNSSRPTPLRGAE